MDKYGNIYQEVEDEIPETDKTRLEGYLIAKAEAGEIERMKRELAKLENEN